MVVETHEKASEERGGAARGERRVADVEEAAPSAAVRARKHRRVDDDCGRRDALAAAGGSLLDEAVGRARQPSLEIGRVFGERTWHAGALQICERDACCL